MFKCNTCLYKSQPCYGIKCFNCDGINKYVSSNEEREENMENKNYIVINGKKAELTEEQLKQLGIEVEKTNPYEIAEKNKEYFFANQISEIERDFETSSSYDNWLYKSGNYCTNEKMAHQDMLHDLLNRKLRQFSNLNGGIELNSNTNKGIWQNSFIDKYYIYYNYTESEFKINFNSFCKMSNTVYFKSEEITKRAIEEIIKPFMQDHKEFVL